MADQELDGAKTQSEGGEATAQPSGPKGDNPATAGQGGVKVKSNTPENADHELNPSAPGETGTTPGTNG